MLFLQTTRILICSRVLWCTSFCHTECLPHMYSKSQDLIKLVFTASPKTFICKTGIFKLLVHGIDYHDYWDLLVPKPWFTLRHQQLYPHCFCTSAANINIVKKANIILVYKQFWLHTPFEWVEESPDHTLK